MEGIRIYEVVDNEKKEISLWDLTKEGRDEVFDAPWERVTTFKDEGREIKLYKYMLR